VALKTGNPAAVNSVFLLFFPFLFLTSAYVPRSQLSGWLGKVATVNPVTYLLGGLRSIVLGPTWQWSLIGEALLAIVALGVVSMSLCFAALRGRIKSGA
jgi:ABC-2 type transport system permease protein